MSEPTVQPWNIIANNKFEVGHEDRLYRLREEFPQEPADDEARKRCKGKWGEFVKESRIRFGTLLKTDTVSFLLGAGASKLAGGVLLGKVPLVIERTLLERGVKGSAAADWLMLFYAAAHRLAADKDKASVPFEWEEIRKRCAEIGGPEGTPAELPVNLESLLSMLFRWRAAIPETEGRLRLDGRPVVDAPSGHLDEAIRETKAALAARCVLPSDEAGGPNPVGAHRQLVKKLLTRPLNLKRQNLFTLNYDTLIEQAADSEGVVALDGFVGTLRRVFRPESYDQDLYFPAETTEGRVHRLDRVLHLYKLHGSITWRDSDPDWDNPYGVTASGQDASASGTALIYPTPLKYGESLGMPYAELFRRFAASVVRAQSVLFVLGYGFGDDHVCAIIRQALTVPSFCLVIVDPDPKSSFVARARDYCATLLMRVHRLLEDRRFEFLFGPVGGQWPRHEHALATFLRDLVGLGAAETPNPALSDEVAVPPQALPYYDRQRTNDTPHKVVIVDLSLLAAEVLENVTALIGRVILEFLQRLGEAGGADARGSLPVVLVLEEAQNYIREKRFGDEDSISRDVFERIAREGRKYGLSLVVASQRPSELSKTVLSQCNSFVVHRLQNPEDLRYFKEIVPGIYGPLLDQLPALAPQTALILGECVRAPALVRIREARPLPRSRDPKFYQYWVADDARKPDVEAISARWEGRPRKQDVQ